MAVDWEELPSVGNVEVALADGAPRLYDDWPDNIAASYETEIGDADTAIAEADVVVRERFSIHRLFACPVRCTNSVVRRAARCRRSVELGAG
jgi:carbon-monoxide dehydrogenase large subunit